jgi:hypothetical protein
VKRRTHEATLFCDLQSDRSSKYSHPMRIILEPQIFMSRAAEAVCAGVLATPEAEFHCIVELDKSIRREKPAASPNTDQPTVQDIVKAIYATRT